jgi:hypothetical protein
MRRSLGQIDESYMIPRHLDSGCETARGFAFA